VLLDARQVQELAAARECADALLQQRGPPASYQRIGSPTASVGKPSSTIPAQAGAPAVSARTTTLRT
jgi:hypothetical protein